MQDSLAVTKPLDSLFAIRLDAAISDAARATVDGFRGTEWRPRAEIHGERSFTAVAHAGARRSAKRRWRCRRSQRARVHPPGSAPDRRADALIVVSEGDGTRRGAAAARSTCRPPTPSSARHSAPTSPSIRSTRRKIPANPTPSAPSPIRPPGEATAADLDGALRRALDDVNGYYLR